MCSDYSVPSLKLLLQHINLVHANNAGFKITCGVDLCEATYANFRRFKEHLKKKHNLPNTTAGAMDNHNNESGSMNDDSFREDNDGWENEMATACNNEEPDDEKEFLKRRAFWIMKVKEKRLLTQATLEEILQDITELCTDLIIGLGHKVKQVNRYNN